MKTFYAAVAVVLLLTILAGLGRILRGPTLADRMLAAQLFGTTGVGVLLLLAFAWDMPRVLDVALVVALLASVVGVAFVSRGWVQSGTVMPPPDKPPSGS
jgi:multicomponent Na+:H+ antiporter subunit F